MAHIAGSATVVDSSFRRPVRIGRCLMRIASRPRSNEGQSADIFVIHGPVGDHAHYCIGTSGLHPRNIINEVGFCEGFQTPAAVRAGMFVTAGVWKPSHKRTHAVQQREKRGAGGM